MEDIKFKYFIVLSLILHLFLLVVFRLNFQKKVEEFRPTYVRIVELPFLGNFPEMEAETNPIAKSKSKGILDSIMPSLHNLSEKSGEKKRSEGSKSEKSGVQNPSVTPAPLPRSPSEKGIRGLPLLTDKDLDKFAKFEDPYLKKKEKSITLDTDEFKYLSYLERLKSRIEFIWKYPEMARLNNLHGDLYIRFTILKNGKLGDAQLLRSSGYKILDDAALQSLNNSDPFWPLPENWNLENLTITGHFIYYLGGLYLQ